MPVIHLELKRSGVHVSQATKQIETYLQEGIFSGLFALVQIFVAMNPNETVYFANPGNDSKFNRDYHFHWADFNNEPLNHWQDIASTFLSIPMAHQLIGFYTVADDTDGLLKVMRSYQYYAANAISDKVAKTDWSNQNPNTERLGGYIWHTTGSGKTMTSFKAAQLIAQSQDADKVVFLMDRIELGTQSLAEYRGFANDDEAVQATENTHVLITKLKSTNPADTLIVSSIQKMSNITADINDARVSINSHDIDLINRKRLVFIIDEAHRSTFGDMLITIKNTFPTALFFGFTGTPIHSENQKKDNTTATVFGNELHRYSIADGIRDKNVLGFYLYKMPTYKDKDLREAVALEKARATTVSEAIADPQKQQVFNRYYRQVPMAGHYNEAGQYIKGIEDEIPPAQYQRDAHQIAVVTDISENWITLSQNSKFHALLATSSITEAIEYYRRFKTAQPNLKVTALFDPNIDYDSNGDLSFKQNGLVEILADYNQRYGQHFDLAAHDRFKKDIAARLAHKRPYGRIEKEPENQIDLLIVVDQMLTGFDSKWLNTLYLDKVLKYENIIQAFSRTNRLFGPDKPFGTIRYYRYPHTMERNINEAVKLYSGDKPLGLFADRLEANLEALNAIYDDIAALFTNAGIENFEILPDEVSERAQFAQWFKQFNNHLEAAKIQGFTWKKLSDPLDKDKGKNKTTVTLNLDETTYLILALRYKELTRGGSGEGLGQIPFDIDGYLTEIDTGVIDADYMNSRFEKYLKTLQQTSIDPDHQQQTLNELHKSFASLSQEEQKYANIFLNEVQRGDISLTTGRTFRDYITEYQSKAKNSQITAISQALGLDQDKLINLMNAGINATNLNEYGRFDDLKNSVDKAKAKAYLEKREGVTIPTFKVNLKIDQLLQDFILRGGFDLE